MRNKKANTIHKRPVNKLFRIEQKYHHTNQKDKAREQTLRWEAAVIGEKKINYECKLRERWEGGRVFEHYKY